MCYISSIFFYFHWDFDNRHYLYDKGTFIGFFKSIPSARLYFLFGSVNDDTSVELESIDGLICYISFCFSIALFSSRKKWLSCLSHAISPYLHGKSLNWASTFYLSFCCTVLPWIYESLWIVLFHLFVFVNYILCFSICNFTSHGICINSDNQQIYYLINIYFFVACVGPPKSVLTKYLGILLGFQNWVIRFYIVVWLI